MVEILSLLWVYEYVGSPEDADYARTMINNAGMMLAMLPCYVSSFSPGRELAGWARDKT